jgi:imidazolonepropionase-like amidohydrolase
MLGEYDPEVGDQIKRANVFVHLSLRGGYLRIKRLEKKSKLNFDEEKTLKDYHIIFKNKCKKLVELNRKKVKIGVVDDASWAYTTFDGFYQELKLMVKAGMTPIETINAATKTSSEAIGLSKIIGTVEPGKIADLVLIKGKPFENIKDLKNVHLVLKEGKICYNSNEEKKSI